MIRAIVLGSGTSNGVPMLGYEYPPGYLDDPRNWRTRASLLIEGPEGNLLVDCGPEMRLQLVREGVMDVEAVLVTHSHADHVMGMDDLRSLCLKTGRPMPVYAQPRDQEAIRRIFPYAFQEFPEGVFVPRFDLRDVTPEIEVAGMRLTTFLVNHGAIPVVGLRVGDFAYLTDVSEIPEPVVPLLRGLDTLVIEGLRHRPHPNHLHLEAALGWIERLAPRRALLTHLSHDFDHSADEARLPRGVGFAYDGLRVIVEE